MAYLNERDTTILLCLSIRPVSWSVGWSVFQHFLKGWTVLLQYSYRNTCSPISPIYLTERGVCIVVASLSFENSFDSLSWMDLARAPRRNWMTYRVFIKYCVFFQRFYNIPDSGLSLFSLGVSECTHTRQVEHQRWSRTGRVQKIHNILRKITIFNGHPVVNSVKSCLSC